jgi:hypothetical protein
MKFVPAHMRMLLLLSLSMPLSGCTVAFHQVDTNLLVARGVSAWAGPIDSPARLFLVDGSVVLLPAGAAIDGGILTGGGTRYNIFLEDPTTFYAVPLDSIVVGQTFRKTERWPALSLLSSVILISASAAIGYAILVDGMSGGWGPSLPPIGYGSSKQR